MTPQRQDHEHKATHPAKAPDSARLAALLGVPHGRPTASQSEAGWALKLKQVSEVAAKDLGAEVVSARLVHVYEYTDRDAALFELETDRGRVQAILSRTGEYTFFWKK